VNSYPRKYQVKLHKSREALKNADRLNFETEEVKKLKNMDEKQDLPDLYTFLVEAELQHYYTTLK
jgi:hypothetical protein